MAKLPLSGDHLGLENCIFLWRKKYIISGTTVIISCKVAFLCLSFSLEGIPAVREMMVTNSAFKSWRKKIVDKRGWGKIRRRWRRKSSFFACLSNARAQDILNRGYSQTDCRIAAFAFSFSLYATFSRSLQKNSLPKMGTQKKFKRLDRRRSLTVKYFVDIFCYAP